MKKPILIALSCLALSSVACHARSPEQYRDDTTALLESKTPEIKACYDELLKSKSDVAGSVRVKFKVQEETGKIFETEVDPNGTSAPPELAQCVVRTIEGLQLTPPDDRTGVATYTWEFKAEAAGGAPAAPGTPGAPAAPGAPAPG